MAHTTKDKEKLLTRVRRIRGQVDGIERALDSEQECAGVLQLMAACRGALFRQNSMRTENSAISWHDGSPIQVIPSRSSTKNLSRGTRAVYLYI